MSRLGKPGDAHIARHFSIHALLVDSQYTFCLLKFFAEKLY